MKPEHRLMVLQKIIDACKVPAEVAELALRSIELEYEIHIKGEPIHDV